MADNDFFRPRYNDKCSICIDDFADRTQTQPCGHNFCFNCIVEWMQIRSVCPLCMQYIWTLLHNFSNEGTYVTYEVDCVVSGLRIINEQSRPLTI